MAILTRDGLISALGGAKTTSFFKTSIASAAGIVYSHFRTAGEPLAATIPATASGNICDRTTPGAIPIPAPSNTSYLAAFSATLGTLSTLLLSDRLVETGTLNGTVTTAQTINSVALPPRAASGANVELWLEIHTALGTTASSVSASYTNQSGVAGRIATLSGGIPASGGGIQRTYRFTLQAGDTGVQSVQTLTLGTSTGAAGAFGIVLRQMIAVGSSSFAGDGFAQGYAETGMTIVPDNACLELMTVPSTTTTGTILGLVRIAQG